ncbi:DUF5979 domain-containing protein [Corynebacterium sp. ES2794-CONJ1]|uniref:DUF5979 domain-containing protein n=1 Tax=Corynebacterium sp. ES2794-CONJ1 TaxID=2980553 RepID=UPI0021D91ABB|nr:DUF5979 domain-containing protein [Corynebacterium sp. ES2794-CONJ1]
MNYPRPLGVSDARSFRVLTTLLSILAVFFTALYAVPSARAQGMDRTDLYVKEVTLERGSGLTPDSPLTVGESVKLSMTWDASAYAGTPEEAKPGDFITFELPSWAAFPEASVAMIDATGDPIADCIQESKKVTCTFTSFVTDKQELKGGYDSNIFLVKQETITDISVPIGGSGATIDLSSIASDNSIASGIKPKVDAPKTEPALDNPAKKGTYQGVTGSSGGEARIVWNIYAPGTGSDVVITDAFDKPIERDESTDTSTLQQSVSVLRRNKETEPSEGGSWGLVSEGKGTATELTTGEFRVEWSIDDQGRNVARIRILNTEDNYRYLAQIRTTVPPTFHQAGDKVNNTATVDDTEVSVSLTAKNVISAYGSGQEGFGNVNLFKSVNGVANNLLPSDYQATFNATITEPGETPRYETLTAGEGEENAAKLENLPAGTEVHITETIPGDIPGYTASTLVFGEGKLGTTGPNDDVVIAADKQSVTFTVRNKGVTEINATNTFKPALTNITVQKKVSGAESAETDTKAFAFTYTCVKDGTEVKTGELTIIGANQEEITNVPLGATCSVIEDRDAAEIPGFILKVTGGKDIKVAVDTPPVVITNTYSDRLYAVGDYVWIDTNQDGQQTPGENPLEGVKVTLISSDGTTQTTTTDQDGRYIFDSLPADTYQVKFELTDDQKEIYSFTSFTTGSDQSVDSDSNTDPALLGTSANFELGPDNPNLQSATEYTDQPFSATGGIDPTWDAGVIDMGSIALIKHVEGPASLSSGSSSQDYEYAMQATWMDKNTQSEKTLDFTIKEDERFTLESLPVGTEVTLSETLPEGSALVTWNAPRFSILGDSDQALVENADGSVTVSIEPNTANEPLEVEVLNTSSVPWWWGLVAAILLLIPAILAILPHPAPFWPAAHPKPALPKTHSNQPLKKGIVKHIAVEQNQAS